MKEMKMQETNKRKRKYIVEGDEPINGQVASSGGIRQNGRLISQYKNPIPLEENVDSRFEGLKTDIKFYVVYHLWVDIAQPLLGETFDNGKKKLIDYFEKRKIKRDDLIVNDNEDENNIIDFPNKRIM